MGLSNLIPTPWMERIVQKLGQRNSLWESLETRLTNSFRISRSELRMVLGAILFSSLVIAITKGPSESTEGKPSAPEISTFIPPGYVLIPIQLRNFESVDSILGPYGVVDLMLEGDNQQSHFVAKNIKLLRAPKNPSLFAVLAPQEQSSRILSADEKGLVAVIKNQTEVGTEFVKTKVQRSRITYAPEE